MMTYDVLKTCKVCGWEHADYTWGQGGDISSFDICDCCGTEFGHEDISLKGILQKRADWMAKGMPWREPKEKPIDWDYKVYLARVPKQFF